MSDFGDALAGCDRARLEEYLEVDDLLYGGVCSRRPVCTGVWDGVSIVFCNKRCCIHIKLIDE